MRTDQNINLTNCDIEPIHIPGSIQPYGCLMCCDREFKKILSVSDNFCEMLGLQKSVTVGGDVREALPPRLLHDLANGLAKASGVGRPALLFGMTLPNIEAVFDVAIHRNDDFIIIEFERGPAQAVNPLEIMQTFILRLNGVDGVKSLLDQTARLTRGLLGYDRVMIYKFSNDGSGVVVSEAKSARLESFLGQHFPAADIPKQARVLYLKNIIRIISDASGARSLLTPDTLPDGRPIDLSYAHLRSVSPIHLEYLRNMGVRASMSVSLIFEGKLWGLIACHHYKPHVLNIGQRAAIELFGHYLSLQLASVIQREGFEHLNRIKTELLTLLESLPGASDVAKVLRDKLAHLHKIITCDGVGLWTNGEWTQFGMTPPRAAIQLIAEFVSKNQNEAIWSTHELAHAVRAGGVDPKSFDLNGIAGALAIPLSHMSPDYLFFFKKELAQTVEWAGDPNKTYVTEAHGERLTPRKSFAIWYETVTDKSEEWSVYDYQTAQTIRFAVIDLLMRRSELLEAERLSADVRQKILNDELNHRVKNILAVIKSLVSYPVEAGYSLEAYVETLKRRIISLATAHDQIIRNDSGGDLHELIEAELSPYNASGAQCVVEGAPLVLDARAYSVMTLVIHELATNAAKYGALSVARGRLEVSWLTDNQENCRLSWRESGGPPVNPPRRKGFGSVLIEQSIPFDLGGQAHANYASSGLEVQLMIPHQFVRSTEPRQAAATVAQKTPMGFTTLAGMKLMAVEDQLLIAMDLEAMLRELGADRVALFSTKAEALNYLKTETPQFAMLDVNLGDETSFTIAEALEERNTPFFFATGYGDSVNIPKKYRDRVIVRKPYNRETLMDAIVRVDADRAADRT